MPRKKKQIIKYTRQFSQFITNALLLSWQEIIFDNFEFIETEKEEQLENNEKEKIGVYDPNTYPVKELL